MRGRILAALIAVVLPVAAFAAEGGKAGMPQLDQDDLGMVCQPVMTVPPPSSQVTLGSSLVVAM